MNWPNVPLGSLAPDPGMFVDGPFGSKLKTSQDTDSGVPLLRLQNVRVNQFNASNLRLITTSKATELKRHSYRSGDVVITKLGDPCGVACLVPPDAEDGIIVSDIIRFRAPESRVDPRYIVHCLNSPVCRRQVDMMTRGTTRPRINLSDMRRIEVPLPPLAEQRRIATILDKADDIRRKRQVIAITQDLLYKSLAQRAFRGDL